MRLPLLLALCLALPAAAAPRPAAPAAPPRPAAPSQPDVPSRLHPGTPLATVNGEKVPITTYLDRLSLQYGPQMREALINETLLRQEARRRKVTASPAEVDAEVRRAYGESVLRAGNEAALKEALQESRGWSPDDFRAALRIQAEPEVLRRKLSEALIKPSDISDADIEGYFNAHRQELGHSDTVKLSHILIRRPVDGDPAKEQTARSRADDLLKQILAAGGANFEELARKESDDRATGAQGGRLPTEVTRGAHPFGSGFDASVFNAPLGLVNQVIPSALGYHIVRIDTKTPGRPATLAEYRDPIRAELLSQRRVQQTRDLLARLRAQAKVDTGKF
jgi:parvulin-like peptidyl-prolyl isomerase